MRGSFQVAFYRMHHLAHWHPRERRIRELVSKARLTAEINRIVDLGCGPGDLALTAHQLGINYYGCDPDAASVALARARFSSLVEASFEVGGAAQIQTPITKRDIVVLNGVAHHLDDCVLGECLTEILPAARLAILDHDMVLDTSSVTALFQRSMQRADRGKYVRPLAFFRDIPHWRLLSMEQFLINPIGLPIWPYFCSVYEPNLSD